MTLKTTVKGTEQGVVRLFVLIRPTDMKRGYSPTIEDIAGWLGVKALDAADIQHIWTDDLTEALGLPEMLMDGYGIDPAQVEAALPVIDAVSDLYPTVFVFIRSGAFMGRAVTLPDDSPLTVVEAFTEPGADINFEPLPNPDPQAVLADPPQKKKPSDAAMGGRVATIALLVMGLLVWAMIKIAG